MFLFVQKKKIIMRQKKTMSTVQKTYSYIKVIYVHNIYFLFQKHKIEETKKKILSTVQNTYVYKTKPPFMYKEWRQHQKTNCVQVTTACTQCKNHS